MSPTYFEVITEVVPNLKNLSTQMMACTRNRIVKITYARNVKMDPKLKLDLGSRCITILPGFYLHSLQ